MTISIREATRQDARTIWEFVTELANFEKLEHHLEGNIHLVERWIFDEPVAKVLIAEVEAVPAGYALYFPTMATFKMKPGIWLEDLYVQERHRGKGVGKALLSAVVELARDQGYARVDWSVLDWNTLAIGFYETFGAEILPDWKICRYSLS